MRSTYGVMYDKVVEFLQLKNIGVADFKVLKETFVSKLKNTGHIFIKLEAVNLIVFSNNTPQNTMKTILTNLLPEEIKVRWIIFMHKNIIENFVSKFGTRKDVYNIAKLVVYPNRILKVNYAKHPSYENPLKEEQNEKRFQFKGRMLVLGNLVKIPYYSPPIAWTDFVIGDIFWLGKKHCIVKHTWPTKVVSAID